MADAPPTNMGQRRHLAKLEIRMGGPRPEKARVVQTATTYNFEHYNSSSLDVTRPQQSGITGCLSLIHI